MTDSLSLFTERLFDDWLPRFCHAAHRNYSTTGFKEQSILRLSEFDARWFLCAVDSGFVEESDGVFTAPQSKATEQIFWQGSKEKTPRLVTLWIEPIITMGALARLNIEYGWPTDRLGMQSKTWAFDLVGYDSTSEREQLVCEVKKQTQEIFAMLQFMNLHCTQDPSEGEPANPTERNAYRKVQGLRRSWPSLFWALGPGGEGNVFRVVRDGESQRLFLHHVEESRLKYECA